MRVQRRLRKQDVLFSKPMIGLLVLVLGAVLYFFYAFLSGKYCLSVKFLERVQGEYNKVTVAQEKMEDRLAFIQTDKGRDGLLRAQRGIGRPGEAVLVLTGEFSVDNEQKKEEVRLNFWQGYWQKIRGWVLGC